jgi:hypothetical protein
MATATKVGQASSMASRYMHTQWSADVTQHSAAAHLRRPRFHEPAPCEIYVGNLPYDVTEHDLVDDVLSLVGPVRAVRGDPARGFRLVTYADEATAASAIRNLHGFPVAGSQASRSRTLNVWWKTGDSRDTAQAKVDREETTRKDLGQRWGGKSRTDDAATVPGPDCPGPAHNVAPSLRDNVFARRALERLCANQ